MKKLLLFALSAAIALSAPAAVSAHETAKKIGIVIFDGVLLSEVAAPFDVFGYTPENATDGFDIYLISEHAAQVASHEGLKLQVDYTFENAPELDILMVPSSYNIPALINNQALVDFVKERGAKVEYLASNCAGAYILGAAGLLDGRKVVTYVGGGKELKERFPEADVQDETANKVMVDGKYISSNGGLVSYKAAFKLLAMIKGDAVADKRKEDLYYNRLAH